MSSETPVRPDLEGLEAAAAEAMERVKKSARHQAVLPSEYEVELAAQMEFSTVSVSLADLLALIAYTRALEEAARPFAEEFRPEVLRSINFRVFGKLTFGHFRRLVALLPLAEQEGLCPDRQAGDQGCPEGGGRRHG